MILGAEEGFELKTVKGAPYQAEAVTEIVQTLADGNRIVRKTTATVARDGEGRVRRESRLAGLGAVPASDGPRLVFVHDPVARTGFVLHGDEKIARRLLTDGTLYAKALRIEPSLAASQPPKR